MNISSDIIVTQFLVSFDDHLMYIIYTLSQHLNKMLKQPCDFLYITLRFWHDRVPEIEV